MPKLTTERLSVIRNADAAAGENLQMCPAAWLQRRELLEHIAASEREESDLVRELSSYLEPYSGGTSSLVDLVLRMRQANQIHQELRAAFPSEPVASESDTDRLIITGPA